MELTKATDVWKCLNGIICLYKPATTGPRFITHNLAERLCDCLNQLEVRPPVQYVCIEDNPSNSNELAISCRPSYADNVLVVGPRYQPQDLYIRCLGRLHEKASGVCVVGINNGNKLLYKLRNTKPSRTYQLKGVLGQASNNYFIGGKVIVKAEYDHVKKSTFENVLASFQAAHQKHMYKNCGVDIQTQAAYDLAAKGLLRPENDEVPILYSFKCIDFEPPMFTIEIHCINEYEDYLLSVIHAIGRKLNTFATCTSIKRVRYGCFNLEECLLLRECNLQNVIDNMTFCKKKLLGTHDVLEGSPTLVAYENN